MEAYSKSLSINADDHELCYNLAVQYGAKGEYDREIEFYKMALAIKQANRRQRHHSLYTSR